MVGKHDFVISCGDALTDKDMFMCSDLGLLVANSQPGLLAWFQQHTPQREHCVVLS